MAGGKDSINSKNWRSPPNLVEAEQVSHARSNIYSSDHIESMNQSLFEKNYLLLNEDEPSSVKNFDTVVFNHNSVNEEQ